jgi:hypothetical protein
VASSGVWPGETSHRHRVFPPSYLSTVEAHLIGSPDPAVGVVFPGSKNSTKWMEDSSHLGRDASPAHATANCPTHERDTGLDADCGVKLDRRSHPIGETVGAGQVAAGRSEVTRRCTAPSRSASRR